MDAASIVAAFLSLGAVGLFCISFAEKFIPIVPSYVMLMLLGMTVSDSAGLSVAIIATVLGSLSASVGWYVIGQCVGEKRIKAVIARFGKYVLFHARTYDRLAAAYRRHHFRATLIGQTIPVARIYLAIPAGILRLGFASFLTAAGAGILIWNTAFLVLGYLLQYSDLNTADVGFYLSFGLIVTELAVLKLMTRKT